LPERESYLIVLYNQGIKNNILGEEASAFMKKPKRQQGAVFASFSNRYGDGDSPLDSDRD
jgi:hypothetical protein